MAAAPPVNIFNPAAAAPDQVPPPGPPLIGGGGVGAPSSMAPPSMGMGIGAGTGVIGGDVAAANERKLMYAQGMTAYEPPKSDGAGQSHITLILLQYHLCEMFGARRIMVTIMRVVSRTCLRIYQ